MSPFQLGSKLLHKYRIDRFRRRKDGVLLYEGVDTSHPRRVCIKLLDLATSTDVVKCARFHDEAHAANVVDIGTCDGLPYFVTADLTVPRPSKRPPPLPKRPSSNPPPLPKPRLPPLPAIPITVDEESESVIISAPPPLPLPPPPPISSETLLPVPTTFETNPFQRKRAPWALVFAVMVAISGIAGWYVGQTQTQSEITPAQAAPELPPRN